MGWSIGADKALGHGRGVVWLPLCPLGRSKMVFKRGKEYLVRYRFLDVIYTQRTWDLYHVLCEATNIHQFLVYTHAYSLFL